MSDSLGGVPCDGPDRRGGSSWSLYFHLLLSVLIPDAHHPVHHAQGQVLTVVGPPAVKIIMTILTIREAIQTKRRAAISQYPPTTCYLAVDFVLGYRFLFWGPQT